MEKGTFILLAIMSFLSSTLITLSIKEIVLKSAFSIPSRSIKKYSGIFWRQ